ncbi:MAG: hypothetical protein AB1847_02040 [bacterium]
MRNTHETDETLRDTLGAENNDALKPGVVSLLGQTGSEHFYSLDSRE